MHASAPLGLWRFALDCVPRGGHLVLQPMRRPLTVNPSFSEMHACMHAGRGPWAQLAGAHGHRIPRRPRHQDVAQAQRPCGVGLPMHRALLVGDVRKVRAASQPSQSSLAGRPHPCPARCINACTPSRTHPHNSSAMASHDMIPPSTAGCAAHSAPAAACACRLARQAPCPLMLKRWQGHMHAHMHACAHARSAGRCVG